MKILHVVHNYHPALGGTEERVRRISERMVDRYGDDVTVICSDAFNCEQYNDPAALRLVTGTRHVNGVRVIRCATVRSGSRQLDWLRRQARDTPVAGPLGLMAFGPRMPGLAVALLREEWDVIMGTPFPCAHMMGLSLLRPWLGTPLVLAGAFHRGEELHEDPFTWTMVRRADAYVAQTDYERGRALAAGLTPDRVAVVAAGADPDLTAGCDPAAARERYGLSGTVFLYAGQIIPGKGLPTILGAAERLAGERDDFSLIVAGSTNSVYAREVRRMIAALPASLRRRVYFHGAYNETEKPELFAAADALLYPSRVDSFGIAVTEAWAAGLPVVVGDCPAQRSFIEDGVEGLFCAVGDVASLAGAMRTLADNRDLAHRLGAAGRRRVVAEYNWERVTERYRALYKGLAFPMIARNNTL